MSSGGGGGGVGAWGQGQGSRQVLGPASADRRQQYLSTARRQIRQSMADISGFDSMIAEAGDWGTPADKQVIFVKLQAVDRCQ